MGKPVISITLSPAIDRASRLKELKPGQVNVIEDVFDRYGGKGINMADVLVQFGIKAIACGLMGTKSVVDFKENLQNRGIEYAFSTVPGETRINVKLFDEKTGATTDINFPAFDCSSADVDLVLAMVMAYDVDYIILGGSLPKTLPKDSYAYMIKELKKHKKKILLDTSGEALKYAVKAKPWFIKPNKFELEELAARELKSVNDYWVEAQKLQQQGVENVVISLGDAGAIFCSSEGGYLCSVPPQKEVSSVGAGDTLLGAWLAAKIKGHSDSEAAKIATATSALSVTHMGVGVTTMEDMEKLKQQITLQKL